jgi:hypothetical protein
MLSLKEINKLNKLKRLEKVIHFLNDKKFPFLDNFEIYFLKSLNEKGKYETLEKIKKLIKLQKNLKLALLPNHKNVNLNKIDSESLVEIYGEEYYDLYLIKNKNDKYYMIIQENNFHKNRANFELVYLEKTKIFSDIIFINKQKLN